MAKQPTIGKCVHCLRDPVVRNWDHVFPKSWYPDSTPTDVYKWQIPSCVSCISELGRIEADLLMIVGLCVDPKLPAAAGIKEKVLRSLDPRAARNDRDRVARKKRAKELMANIESARALPLSATYPGLPAVDPKGIVDRIAFRLAIRQLERVAEKMVRGLVYLEDGKFIEPPFSISFYGLDEAGASPAEEIFKISNDEYARGPGVRIQRAVAPEDGMTGVYKIEIWGEWKLYASVTDAF